MDALPMSHEPLPLSRPAAELLQGAAWRRAELAYPLLLLSVAHPGACAGALHRTAFRNTAAASPSRTPRHEP